MPQMWYPSSYRLWDPIAKTHTVFNMRSHMKNRCGTQTGIDMGSHLKNEAWYTSSCLYRIPYLKQNCLCTTHVSNMFLIWEPILRTARPILQSQNFEVFQTCRSADTLCAPKMRILPSPDHVPFNLRPRKGPQNHRNVNQIWTSFQ